MDWIVNGIGNWLKDSALGALFGGLEPAMLTFLALGTVGAVVLLISLLLDGIFEALDFGDGPLSLTTLAAFISVFGFSALTASALGLSPGGSTLVGALTGLIGAGSSFLMTRSMKRMEANGHEESSFVGLSGIVTIPIPPGGLGEVAISKAGERLIVSARSESPIAAGQRVIVQDVISSNSVAVIPAS
jgi:membrane protein implicated in regulation of membrane protease activity